MRSLDNCLVGVDGSPGYQSGMVPKDFRQRAVEAFERSGMTVAELQRRSGVPYHTIDKFLKREGATTGAENARALARALEISVDAEAEYDSLRSMIEGEEDPERRRTAVEIARSAVAAFLRRG